MDNLVPGTRREGGREREREKERKTKKWAWLATVVSVCLIDFRTLVPQKNRQTTYLNYHKCVRYHRFDY